MPRMSSGVTTHRFGYRPALDGLRGVAVLSVVLYHTRALHGGWLGVEVFFVLSGFLITSILFAEMQSTARINLVNFWRRRARRLLPALFLMIGAITVYGAVISLRSDLTSLRREVIGALTYTSNWVQIYGGGGYWGQFTAPSPLRHMWSLAVEEQFYLAFPFVALVTLRRRRPHIVLWSLTALAVTWQITMAFFGSVDRVYLGTDTRLAGILLGASLAVTPIVPAVAGILRRLAIPVALGLAVAIAVLDGANISTFRGPFQAATIAAAILVVVCADPHPKGFGAAMTQRPLVYVGKLSYGLYLFHWPIADALEQKSGLSGWWLAGVTLLISFPIAVASYHLIETPIRHHGLGVLRPSFLAPAAAAALAVAPLVLTTALAVPAVTSVTAGSITQAQAPNSGGVSSDRPLPMAGGRIQRPPDRRYRVMIVGDSVGHSLAERASVLANDAGIRVFSRAAPSCGFDRDLDTWQGGAESPDCLTILDQWPSDVAAFRPDLVIWMYGSWSTKTMNGALRTQCDPELRDRVLSSYESGLSVLSGTGARVAFVGPADWGPPAWEKKVITDETHQAYECTRANIRSFVGKHPASTVALDLQPLLCEGKVCDATADGQLVREDGVHPTGPGGLSVALHVLDQVLQPPVSGWPHTAPIVCCGR